MTNVPEKLEALVTSLRHVAPTRAELRELLVFLFAGSLEGLEPTEASVFLVRVTKFLDIGAQDLKAAIERGLDG